MFQQLWRCSEDPTAVCGLNMVKGDFTKAEQKWRKRSIFQKRRSHMGAILVAALIIVAVILLATNIFYDFPLL